jgi:hypothetical protein
MCLYITFIYAIGTGHYGIMYVTSEGFNWLVYNNICDTKVHVLYGCETWSPTLTEEYRLRVFENWVLRRIFGPKREEVTGSWRRLHNEELHNLYASPNLIRVIKSSRIRWVGHVASMGEIFV